MFFLLLFAHQFMGLLELLICQTCREMFPCGPCHRYTTITPGVYLVNASLPSTKGNTNLGINASSFNFGWTTLDAQNAAYPLFVFIMDGSTVYQGSDDAWSITFNRAVTFLNGGAGSQLYFLVRNNTAGAHLPQRVHDAVYDSVATHKRCRRAVACRCGNMIWSLPVHV